MGEQVKPRQRSIRSARRRRTPQRRQSTLGLRLLLLVSLLVLAGLLLARLPPGLLITGGIVILALFLLVLGVWLHLRLRPKPEEQQAWQRQEREPVSLEQTAQVMSTRALELQDLAYLRHDEFEYFTGALLEALGILFAWERVGGAGDRGVDVRGKDLYDRPFIVQCKLYFGGSIGARMTREFRGAWQGQGAGSAWFVTTSTFTVPAEREVSDLVHRGNMALVDGQKLMAYIHEHWDALPVQWQQRLSECMLERDQQVREGY